jgi:hypothetical protein
MDAEVHIAMLSAADPDTIALRWKGSSVIRAAPGQVVEISRLAGRGDRVAGVLTSGDQSLE